MAEHHTTIEFHALHVGEALDEGGDIVHDPRMQKQIGR